MDGKTQTTFIPKRPVTSLEEHRGIGFFSLIALIIFLSVTIAAGGIFAWKYSLNKIIAEQKKDLEAQEKAFDRDFIAFIVRLNARIEAAKILLDKHVAVSSVFESLQRSTLQSVQFQSFTFGTTPVAGKDMLRISMNGVARDFSSLAAQSQEFGKNKYFKEPLFSNFTRNEEGRVNFTFDAMVDPSLIEYRARISGNLFKPTPQFVPEVTATSTTATSSPNAPRP